MKKQQKGSAMALVVGLLALIIVALGAWQFMQNNPAAPTGDMEDLKMEQQMDAQGAAAAAAGTAQAPVTLEGGLIVQDVKVGSGAEAKPGMRLSVHYTGTLHDGTVFDSSVARNDPLEFTLGVDPVIEGWQRGFAGMKVGGERKITIPPELGYGASGNGPIPPNSTLHFEVVLLGIEQ